MAEPEGGLVEYSYNAAKRLTTVKRNGMVEGAYEYNALGMRTKLLYGNGAYAEYQYNHPRRWLTALNNKKSDGTIISSFSYTYDNVGNRMTMALANGDLLAYAYDNIYQLTSETRTGTTPYQISWTYDEVGNRLTQNKNGVQSVYSYNDANQLLTETTDGVTTTYEFDPNGNQIKRTKGTEISTWTYDYENRQVAYSDPMNSGQYWHDASGRRIKKYTIMTAFKSGGTQNAGTKIGVGNGKGQGQQNGQGIQNAQQNMTQTETVNERYFYDGVNIIADYNTAGALQATYVTPFLDQNLTKNIGANKYYYLQDGLGSVRNILDINQAVKNSYDYSAFGETLSETEPVPNRYKFTGREWDKESQTYYYRIRQFNSYIGTFSKRDIVLYGNDTGLYIYAMNNPVNNADPMGLYSYKGESYVEGKAAYAAKVKMIPYLYGVTDICSKGKPTIYGVTAEGCCCLYAVNFEFSQTIYYPRKGDVFVEFPGWFTSADVTITDKQAKDVLQHENIHAIVNRLIAAKIFAKKETDLATTFKCWSFSFFPYTSTTCKEKVDAEVEDMIEEVEGIMKTAAKKWHSYTGEETLSTTVFPSNKEVYDYFSWVYDIIKEKSK